MTAISDDSVKCLVLQVAALRQALGYFIADDRFVVSVGGNPNVVEKMIERVRDLYESTAV